MGHAIRIQSDEQYIKAIRVLNKVPGTFRGIGPSEAPVLLLTDRHYRALVKAGVIPSKRAEAGANGKKGKPKKDKS